LAHPGIYVWALLNGQTRKIMKTKILLWSVVAVLVIGIAIGAFLWLARPQVITLKDGTKLTLVGGDLRQASCRAQNQNSR